MRAWGWLGLLGILGLLGFSRFPGMFGLFGFFGLFALFRAGSMPVAAAQRIEPISDSPDVREHNRRRP